jgi:hypothetical protein
MISPDREANPLGQLDPLIVLLWIRSLELAIGRPIDLFLEELETWPACYRPMTIA